MRLSNDFISRDLFGETVLIYIGSDPKKAEGLFTLNDTGAFILNCLKETDDEKEIVRRIAREFETDEATAAADLTEYLGLLKEAGVTEE